MKATWKFLALTSLIAFSGLLSAQSPSLSPLANNQVTVKLVLGEDATLAGYQGVNDETIYHYNVVTYTATSDSALPTPTKPGTTFVSWVYAQSSTLVRTNKMPKTSGAVYYAYWQGDGSLATTIASSQTSSSLITSSSLVTTSSEPFVPFNLYFQAKTPQVDWTIDQAQIRLFFWNTPQTLTWPGIPMVSEGNGLYSYRFESFTPRDLLFVRVNPEVPTQVWNQTVNLIYTAPLNLFSLTAWNGGEGQSIGVWSAYSPTTNSESSSNATSLTSSSVTVAPSLTTSSSSVTLSSASLVSSEIVSSPLSSSPITSTSELISSSLLVSSETLVSSQSETSVANSSEPPLASSSLVESSTASTTSEMPLTFDVYLKVNDPRADWSQDSPSFELHYWGNNQGSTWTNTPIMTALGNGIFHYVFNDGQPTHLLFLRKSPNRLVIWNMTIDYAYPGDDAMLTITSWTSNEFCGDCLNQGTKSTGEWSTYIPA